MTQRRNCSAANPRTEARYKLDQLRRAADDGLPSSPGTVRLPNSSTWRTKALPNRDLSPARIASHGWAIRVLTHELGTIRLQALTIGSSIEISSHRSAARRERSQPQRVATRLRPEISSCCGGGRTR